MCNLNIKLLGCNYHPYLLSGLNGLALGDYKLSVQRVPAQMAAMLLVPPTPTQVAAPTASAMNEHSSRNSSVVDPLMTSPPSCVLRLSNMTTDEDLNDDEAFDEMQVKLLTLNHIGIF